MDVCDSCRGESLALHRFIEHGEYKENQYGTSIEAIRSVQAKNKMCIVDVQPEVGPCHDVARCTALIRCHVTCAHRTLPTCVFLTLSLFNFLLSRP